ncbi:MAG TPA: glucoamylase family protein, partial [Thermoanaerobaculia bacterium]|nr:glucoamylase family protein [Thermoanaerobaculia bacterium]
VEYRRQTTMNVTVRNVITSMRLISALDWAAFVESVSLVDEALAAHPGYRAMEFATRDRYRHGVEELARDARTSEIEVARQAVKRAAEATGERPQDPGYDLIAGGLPAFERALGARLKPERRLRCALVAWAAPAYLGAILLVTGVILAVPLSTERGHGLGLWSLVLLGLLALVPASELAIQLVNSWVTRQLGPRILPRLELRDGVPPELRTLVAVPTLLTSTAEIEEQIARLEVHYLANPEPELRFALLSDWRDAPAETLPEDAELLAAARAGIARLNLRHGPTPAGDDRFYLFHRRRMWNESEQCWLGWERKRGKLEELNRLLRGDTGTTFLDPVAPPGIAYVLTLDADTRLPREAARRLIGTLAHPLNRPRFDARLGRVVAGYGVLQPRITATLPTEADGSLFQRVFSGPAGIDPYAAAVSDVYQDLFGEGSFTGKGIYDVDAFTAALDGKVPDDRLLSHDLFEGIFARTGLVTDVELFEEFPSHFEAAAARQHRWARGDWQLLPWILGRGSTADGRRVRIPAIGRFKMLDNLRRTLWAPAAFLTLLAGWTLAAASPAAAHAALWTGFVLTTMALPPLLRVLSGLAPRRHGISKRSHLLAVAADLRLAAVQVALAVVFLCHQAWLMTDAILRTLARLYVTRRRLLQWVTAAQAKVGLSLDLGLFYQRMEGGVNFAAVAALAVAISAAAQDQPGSWQIWAWAAPLLVPWALAPAVARWLSLPPAPSPASPLRPEEAQALRLIARRTWRFFETFVGPEDHALPPDNFQDDPRPVVAHRTSPTNLGLYLLAVVAARDFGWLGTADCVARLEETLETMGRLEPFRGHLFNWYETRDLRALAPRYVSTVDSGNLAGHLLTLAEACRHLREQPLLGRQALLGVSDAVELIRASAPASAGRRTQTVTRRHLDEALDALAPALAEATLPATPAEWAARLEALAHGLHAVVDVARALAGEQKASADAAAWGEVLAWAELAQAGVESHRRDLGEIAAPASGDGLLPSPALAHRLDEISRMATDIFSSMDFSFLYDPARKLFSIGYRVDPGELDAGFYDLLASEARLASFIAVAKGEVPVAHWFHLGRPLTPVSRGAALISWSGSMFEYLMPALVMRSPAHSLLDQTCRLVVRRQVQYGRERGVPWGVSESAFNARDVELTYQYSNFGVPGLGLKRGLSEDVVVAPYATALAAMFEPRAAVFNFAALAGAGARGRYGYCEAIDYTASRLPEGQDHAVVHAWMAHHQGMSLLALANVLDVRGDGGMPARFHAAPLVQATELLLQERTPRDVAVARPRAEEVAAAAHAGALAPPVVRRYSSPHHAVPRSHLLSNGRYTVMLTAAGGGYSRFRTVADSAGSDLAITRFREDTTRDCWGSFVFFRDLQSGQVWSAGFQASGVEPASYEVTFSEDRAEIARRDGVIASRLEVVVTPEDDAEVRRVSLANLGLRVREIELTSYAEIVLAPPAADLAHPAFSNLFVETEWVPRLGALLATRRPRSTAEPRLWAAHVAAVAPGSVDSGETAGDLQFETDRARFLGRGRGVRTPMSVIDGLALSNTAGAVLDPIFSLRRRVRLDPGTTARVTFTTLLAPSREAALSLADKYRDPAAFERAAGMAWTQAQVQLRHLGVTHDEANLFQRLANRVLYSDPSLRPAPEVLARNSRGASTLWPHGISGDLPILLVRIDEIDDLGVVRQLLQAHEYFRTKGLAIDLVILNDKAPSYVQDLQGALEAVVRSSQSRLHHEGHQPHGNVYILRSDLLPPEVRDILLAAARAVLGARDGSLFEQLERRARVDERRALPAPGRTRRAAEREPVPSSPSPSPA